MLRESLAALIQGTGGFSWLGSYFDAAGENRRLKQQLQDARRVEDRATALGLENARLRTMLGVRTEPAMPMITARVVFDGRGPFRRAQLANAGTDKGVAIGYPLLLLFVALPFAPVHEPTAACDGG